ncbi:MAG TPA: protein kinase [Gemmatimonadaceae bacterium]|nr:protein kinase [Gemmatimonadaceae bacterium]
MNAAAQLNASLSGRYAIDREIGRGGMATVYLARDVRHNRLVALKVLSPELAALLGAERFLSEIRVTANLQHPHILPLFDSGQADGLLFYVMPYVPGESLRTRLERERVLPVGDAVRIASEVAAALESAHRQGVIHRDIKPENILLQDGAALVADFGIALAVSNAGGERLTQTGLSLGTPQYMSPEQATGERTLDYRTDIYSLGAVCYEMLAGEPPFGGPTLPAIIARVMTEAPRPISAQRRTVSAALERAVLRALEKLPADRFASATEFAEALSASDTAPDRSEPSRGARPRVSESEQRYARGRWWSWAVTTVAVLAAIWIATQSPSSAVVRESVLDMDLSGVVQVPGPVSPGTAVLSPDGSVFAILGLTTQGPRIHFRRLADLTWRVVPDERVASALGFSPDGSQLAFARGWPAGTDLMVASADGSGAARLASLPPEALVRRRIAWTDRGLVAAGVAGLVLYALDGTSRPLTTGARDFQHILPSWLRSRDAVVYSMLAGRGGSPGVGIARLTDTAGTVLTTEAVAAVAGYDDHVVLVGPEGNLWT